MSDRPLVGLRVLELAQEIAAPYGGKLLADLGAKVTKVEPPGGDPSRERGPFPGGRVDRERGGLFHYLNSGRQGLVLDLAEPADRDACLELCRSVDVVLESSAPGELDRLGLGFAALGALNPRLVLVSVTPFGQFGPRAGWRGNDLIAFHGAGFAYGFPSLQVDSPHLPPLNAPSYGAAFLAGEMVAAAAVHGLLVARRSGRGAHLDVSLQEAVAAENQSQHNVMERTGAIHRKFSDTPSNSTVALLPCSDGWVAISPREEHQWARWLEVMGDPEWGRDPRFADRRSREQRWPEVYPLLATWSRERSKHQIFEAAQEARVACYPLGVPADLLTSPQLAARGFFQRVEDAELGEMVVPRAPYRMAEGKPATPRRGPRLGEHNSVILSEAKNRRTGTGSVGLCAGEADPSAAPQDDRVGPHDDANLLPLAGVRIVDFSWVMTGPICTKYLAALGAEVIKVESRARPDLSHRDTPWEELNPSKRSITLNMKHDRARDLARRLIAVSDVVVENFSTGVMERLGLDYGTLRELNPRIIMASSSALGRTGPERDRIAYGTLIQCFTGWATLSAHPGRPPQSSAGIWTDPLTATMETFLLLAAIWRQRLTGQGCFFDLSMAETTIAALPEPILAWSMNQELLVPRGNRDPLYAPQGCYPASGDDRWVALSVQTDASWAALCQLMGRIDLLANAELASVDGRRTRHDALDEAIADWTRLRPAEETAAQLQAAGIAATPTLTAVDVLADEHLTQRAFASQVESLAGGTRWTLGFPWLIDGQRPDRFRRPPSVGQDNDYVFRELLGLADEECRDLIEQQIIY